MFGTIKETQDITVELVKKMGSQDDEIKKNEADNTNLKARMKYSE
jgi:hypothetical protein